MSLAEGFRYLRLQEAIERLIDEFGAQDVIDAARALHQERRDAEYARYREEMDSAITGRSTAAPKATGPDAPEPPSPPHPELKP